MSDDESLISTKGRTEMLQYIPSKAAKYGVKLWLIVESVSGYMLHTIVYRVDAAIAPPYPQCL